MSWVVIQSDLKIVLPERKREKLLSSLADIPKKATISQNFACLPPSTIHHLAIGKYLPAVLQRYTGGECTKVYWEGVFW